MIRVYILAVSLILTGTISEAQTGQVLWLKNCQLETRTVTYSQQANIFVHLVAGWTTLKDQKWIKFSPDYQVDTSSMEKQIASIRRSLPVNYFKSHNLMGEGYNNIPDEKAIWFTLIFSNGEGPKNLKIFSSIKILFTGDDARVESQRSDPRIQDVRFITDPKELQSIKKKLTSQALI